MKNIFKLLSLALVGSTLFVGCQKEEARSISFSFENADSPKSYIHSNFNCWETNENIYINGGSNPVIVTNGNSTVSHVSGYSAAHNTPLFCFYGGSQNTYDNYDEVTHTYSFVVPTSMTYKSVANEKQKTDAPVAGYGLFNANGRTRIPMKNLGSMLKFNFQNNSNSPVTFNFITVYSRQNSYYIAAPIAGNATATVPSSTGTLEPYTIESGSISKTLNFDQESHSVIANNSDQIYFPIASIEDARLGLEITYEWHRHTYTLKYDPTSDITINRNDLLSLPTISFNHSSNGGANANDEQHYSVQIGTTTLSLENDLFVVSNNHWTLTKLR